MTGTIVIDQERCKGCQLCTLVCPQHVLSMATDTLNARGYAPARLAAAGCTGCAVCAIICPDVCITVYREPARARRGPEVAS
ncbi:MAG: 4Fe-4S binding protein [Anaerolineae bacterium]|nr:4Fe-4S binding protein [Anaerolineae bacterium]